MLRSMARLSDLKDRESSEVMYLRPTLSESSTRSQSRLKGTRLRKQGGGRGANLMLKFTVEKIKKYFYFFFSLLHHLQITGTAGTDVSEIFTCQNELKQIDSSLPADF